MGQRNARIFILVILLGFLGPTAWASKTPVLDSLTEDLLQKAEPEIFAEKKSSEWIGEFAPVDALRDPALRINEDFRIPEILKRRTQFWFDIYTKYGEQHHVIHHTRFPWIVYKIIDLDEHFKGKKLHRWTRYHKGKRLVQKEKNRIRKTLRRLAKRKNFRNLRGLERDLYNKLIGVRGSRKKVFNLAARKIRTQLGQKDFFLNGLKSSNRYLPYMEEEFRDQGLPTELTRIPFVESSFNVKAQSKVGASGIWQIMPRVGKTYFHVNKYIDERNSPLKASMAAADIMKRNYRSLKDWPLAVTAYNVGSYGVRKALKKSKSTNLPQLITRYHKGSFRFASANFYSSFLAVLHAEKYHQEIFQDLDINKEDPLRYSVYQLDKKLRAKRLLKLMQIDKETFLAYNMDLKNAVRKNAWVPKGFRLLVPLEKRLEIDAKLGDELRPIREARNSDLNLKDSSI